MISVILPVFNEAALVGKAVSSIHSYFHAADIPFELIVVNDGSRDGTLPELDRLRKIYGFKIISFPANRGKGAAVRRGVLEARGDFLFFLDTDLAVPIGEFDKFRPYLDGSEDVVIGSRRIPGSAIIGIRPRARRWLGEIFYQLVYALLTQTVRDTNCGFKLFRRETALQLFSASKIDGWGFDVEILFWANKLGCKIKEIPITWYAKPHSNVRIVRAAALTLWEIFKIRMLHQTEIPCPPLNLL